MIRFNRIRTIGDQTGKGKCKKRANLKYANLRNMNEKKLKNKL